MTVKLFIPKHTSHYDEYISIAPQGFGFSAKFIKNNNLSKKNFVEFGNDNNDEYRFYVGFPDEKKLSCLELQGFKGSSNRQVKASEFINEYPILKEIKNDKNLHSSQRRFELTWDKEAGMYNFGVIPNFEKECTPDNLKEDEGIYRYKNTKDDIIYIGIGEVKKRFKAPERASWINEVKKIEYSIIKEKKDREKFENIYLKAFVMKYGKRPKYNKNLGKKINK